MWSLNTVTMMAKLFPLIIQSVAMVESVVKAKGKAKQDAAVEAVKMGVQTTEAIAHKDIFNDPEVELAVRAGIDATVHGMNSLNKATATP